MNTTIASMFGYALPEEPRPSESLPLPLCFIGLEVEVENFPSNLRPSNYPKLRFIDDGSLRSNGSEILFKGDTG